MSKNLEPGMTIPDFRLPDENGAEHSLSELQGDDVLVLMLGRGDAFRALGVILENQGIIRPRPP